MEWYSVEFAARTSVMAESEEDAKQIVYSGNYGDIDILDIVETYEEDR